MVRAVVMDMDGLMFDTERLSFKAWAHAGKKYGYDITEDICIEAVGRNVLTTKGIFIRHLGEGIEGIWDRLYADRVAFSSEYIRENGMPIMPGLMEFLQAIQKRNLPVAVATSSNRDVARFNLQTAGILDAFDAVISGDMVERGKPNPDIFLAAMDALGAKAEACIVLEDSLAGILAAHRAGALPVMVPDVIMPDEETLSMLYARCDTLGDAIALLPAL